MVAMVPDANPGGEVDDEIRLSRYAADLADGVERVLPSWVEREVERLSSAYHGRVDDDIARQAAEAGRRAQEEVGPRVRALLERAVDEQRTNPLAIIREAVVYPTAVLRAAGVPPVVRDEMAEEHFPDDDYDLTPTRFADLDPDLHEPGLRWGAAKAFVFKERRRQEGKS
jgi:hypothetical protein